MSHEYPQPYIYLRVINMCLTYCKRNKVHSCSSKGCTGGTGVQWYVCLLWVLGWLYSSAQETSSTCWGGAFFAAWGSAAALGNSCSGCKVKAGVWTTRQWRPVRSWGGVTERAVPEPPTAVCWISPVQHNPPVATGAPLVPGQWLRCAARWRATVSVGWVYRIRRSTGWLVPAPPAATGVKWMPAGCWMIVLKGITDNYKTNWCECRNGLSLS